MLDGVSGITSLPKKPEFEQIPSQVAGFVPRGNWPGEFQESDWVSTPKRKYMSLSSAYALCASSEAAGWKPESEKDCLRTGVSIGGNGNALDIFNAGELIASGQHRKISPYFIPLILNNMPSGHVSMRFGLQGPNHSVSTACATGTHAVGDAAAMIQRGACDVMVAGGTEACIENIVMFAFHQAKALSTKHNNRPESASRPFDAERDGFVISEGAGVMVLEELEHAKGKECQNPCRNSRIWNEWRRIPYY